MAILTTLKKRKRLLTLSLLSATALSALGVALVGPALPVTGSGTFCLAKNTGLALTGTQGAAEKEGCVALPGKGNLSMDLMSGEIPLKGGMRLSAGGHRLDVTGLRIRVPSRTTTADIAVDGGARSSVTFLTYGISPSHVTVDHQAARARAMNLKLAEPAGAAFRKAFPAAHVAPGGDLFVFDGSAAFTPGGVPAP
ncbi:hypothetical protein [Streptomyces griseocarneus]|uniref:hypothetical protein n=1 Tax=Streptomyces griseocarneus TaxID=51201 RepID=UPI00167D0C96|nr:hypothetical protein [Streptomyces griseocarneus]MBZ6476199.1 hypothetical protein [Streptomyces griseocarneus]GHG63440.1 hypothetical protein GCM10018779_33040 [Streptomyces griseocarneus]